MLRWTFIPLMYLVLLCVGTQCQASDFRVSVGVGDGYVYYPHNYGYTTYYPYTYDTYGYYTPRYVYTTPSTWYSTWGNDSWRDNTYWRGSYWDGGRRGSWDGRGRYDGVRGGFTVRGRL